MRAMLRKLYQPAREFLTAKPSKRDRFDISKFAIFGKTNLKMLKDFSDRWKDGWTSLWLRSVKKSKDALTSVGLELEERMIVDEGAYDLNVGNFSDDDEPSSSFSKKQKKNKNFGDIEPTVNSLSQRYMKSVRAHAKLKFAFVKKCTVVHKSDCEKCFCRGLIAALGDACQHAKQAGAPFVKSDLITTVHGARLPMELPSKLKSLVS